MITRVQLAIFAAFLSVGVQAHPGHDHSHWLSSPIHAVTIVAVLAIAAVAVAFTSNAKRRAIKNKIEEK